MDSLNWNTIKKIIILGIGIGVLCFLFIFSSARQRNAICTNIKIELPDSENFVQKKEVFDLVNKRKKLIGSAVNSFNLNELEENIGKNPFVEKAELSIDLSGVLRIKVSQKHPVMLVHNVSGQRYYVDSRGFKMPYFPFDTTRFYQTRGYIKEGYSHVDTLLSADLKAVYYYTRYLENYPLRKKKCRTFFINKDHEIELSSSEKSFYFLMGDTSDLDKKFERMDIMYSVVFPKEGFDAYKMINLKFADQLVCIRKEKKSINDIN